MLDVHVRRHVVDARLEVPLDDAPVTVLFGPSGAGKTSVLRAVAGLDPAGSGHVRFGEEVWDRGDGRRVPARRRGVGYVFQEAALFPHLDVAANVRFGLHRSPEHRSREQGSREHGSRHDRVREALAGVGAEHLLERRVSRLSGGEAQRVALARALAPGPRLLLLDEPLSSLDGPTRAALRGDLRRVLLRHGVPTLLVTHDRTEALALGDRAAVLVDGVVRQLGLVADVFDRPVDADVARVVGIETAVPGVVTSVDRGLASVAVAGSALMAVAAEVGPGDAVLVCVRAEDVAVVLADDAPHGSQRNRLRATVVALTQQGPLVRVDLDAGFRLSAYITRAAGEDLALRPGLEVRAVVKSTAVHVVQRPAG